MICGFICPFDTQELQYGRHLFECIDQCCPDFVPTKCGNDEPYSTPFDDRETALREHWEDRLLGFYWKGSKPKTEAGACHAYNINAPFSQVSFWDERADDKLLRVESFKSLLANIDWEVTFAYFHQSGAEEFAYYKDNFEAFPAVTNGVVPVRLAQFIPTLTWGCWLGKPYIELIGEAKLLSAPAYKAEKHGDLIYLQLTKDFLDPKRDFSRFQAVRESVIHYLGDEFFYSADRPKSNCVSPRELRLQIA